MNNEKIWLTPKEAGDLIDMTSRNVTNLIRDGKIKAERDESGRFHIQKSEFYRVFPRALDSEIERNLKKMPPENTASKLLEEKNNHLMELIKEKAKQIDFLKEQLDNFNQEKSKMLDAISIHARLLEYKQKSTTPSVIEGNPPKKGKWSKIFSKD